MIKENRTPYDLCEDDSLRSPLQVILEPRVQESVINAVSLNKKCWNRSKVMLVGQGRAGKSSLARVILGEKFVAKSPSTCGIDKFEVNVSAGIVDGTKGHWRKFKKEGSHLNIALASICVDQHMNGPTQLNDADEDIDHDNIVEDADDDDVGDDDGDVGDYNVDDTIAILPAESNNIATNTLGTATISEPPSYAHKLPFDVSLIAKVSTSMDSIITDSELLLNLFDFGGQDIFYCVHPFFLTASGAYVVVFSMKDILNSSAQQNCLSHLIFWMNSIAMHTKRGGTISDIYIVGTHKDQVRDTKQWTHIGEVLRRTLSASVAWSFVIKEDVSIFYPVDCTIGLRDPVARKLMQTIESRLKTSSFVLDKHPLTWFSVLDELEMLGEHFPMISFGHVEAIGDKYSIRMDELISLLRFFREMGVLLWYEEPASLRDAIILNPVADFIVPVTRIICDPELHALEVHMACRNTFSDNIYQLFRTTGVAAEDLLRFILGFGGHDPGRLIEMMQMYGLLVHWQPVRLNPEASSNQAPVASKYLVPSLFPGDEVGKTSVWNSIHTYFGGSPSSMLSSVVDPRSLEVRIPHEKLLHWNGSCQTFFLVFSLDAWLPGKLLRLPDLQQQCFLPAGIFDHLVSNALLWSQYTPDCQLSSYKLQKRMVEMSFGNVKF